MKYFGFENYNGQYSLYDLQTGQIFFKKENNEIKYLDELENIKNYLSELIDTLNEDSQYDYNLLIKSKLM